MSKERLKQLRTLLTQYNYEYHVLDKPTIADVDYDQLFKELVELEEKYPEEFDANSPTQRIGGLVLEGFNKIRHQRPMMSLGDVFNYEELNAWCTKVENEVGTVDYCVECKIDGLAMSVHYASHTYQQAVTRGDGEVGEDVTNNVRTVKSLPMHIDYLNELEVRGEVYMPRAVFRKINEQRQKEGQEPLANCRNAAAGSIRQLDSSIAASRQLDAFWYQLPAGQPLPVHSQMESLEWLKALGFKVNPEVRICHNMEEIWQFIEEIGNRRDELAYDIDGVVVKVNDFQLQRQLGYTARTPKWAIAYKFPAEQVTTQVEDIFVTVGRTGKITPNAKLTSVRLAGSTVSYATLHNEDQIRLKDIRIGDEVIVRKAGDIIPEVVASLAKKRDGSQVPYVFPTTCPICHEPLHRYEDEAAHYCINSDCPARVASSIAHFASRDAMNIDGLGEKRVEAFHQWGWLKSIEDIYHLRDWQEEIVAMNKFGQKSYDKLMAAIDQSKSNSLEKLIFGLGIRQVGEKAAKVLAQHYKTMDALMNTTAEELQSIADIGSITAEAILSYFNEEANRKVIEGLKACGVNMTIHREEITESIFTGKKIVLTGTLESYSRSDAGKLLESLGARIVSSVSKNTDIVIAGTEAGSKLDKALALGVQVMNEEEFLAATEEAKQDGEEN